jgi:hypothetical protein
MALNENHQRHLLSTFQYVDNLLSEAERILASAGAASPFQEYSQDTTPIQRKVTHDYIVRVREAMRRILEELKIPLKLRRSTCEAMDSFQRTTHGRWIVSSPN